MQNGFTRRDARLGNLRHVEDGPDGYRSRPPAFESGGDGLVPTADPYLAFASALRADLLAYGFSIRVVST